MKELGFFQMGYYNVDFTEKKKSMSSHKAYHVSGFFLNQAVAGVGVVEVGVEEVTLSHDLLPCQLSHIWPKSDSCTTLLELIHLC